MRQYLNCVRKGDKHVLFSLDNAPLIYNRNYSHTVLFHEEGSKSLFVGGSNIVLHFDVDSYEILEVIIKQELVVNMFGVDLRGLYIALWI